MHVTVFADASYSDKLRKGGWAFYLKSAEGEYLVSGPCGPEIESSNQAEMHGMYEGLKKALSLYGEKIQSVTIVGDSQSALREFAAWESADGESGESLLKRKIGQLVAAHGNLRLSCQWKKGRHKRPSGTKISSHISALCDQLAKVAMRKE